MVGFRVAMRGILQTRARRASTAKIPSEFEIVDGKLRQTRVPDRRRLVPVSIHPTPDFCNDT